MSLKLWREMFVLLISCLLISSGLMWVPPSSADEEVHATESLTQESTNLQVAVNVVSLMHKYEIPGGQFCIAKGGHIIYSGAFGWSDEACEKHVNDTNLFRIASISKVVTAVAVWQLVERGQLSLSDKAFEILSDLKPTRTGTVDSRLNTITVAQLLQHASGFGYALGDPQFKYERIAADAAGTSRPASPAAIIRYAMTDPLDFDPGTKSVYTNINFNILGRIVEKVSGQEYGDFVRKNILEPTQITDMQLGRTDQKLKAPLEVFYWGGQNQRPSWSVFDSEPLLVASPYGGDYAIECLDSHGGWLASASDLVRLASAINGSAKTAALLKSTTLDDMLSPTQFPSDGSGGFRAQGVPVNPALKLWSHTGAMSGASAFLYSFDRDVVIAAVFNRLPTPDPFKFFQEMDDTALSVRKKLSSASAAKSEN